MNISHMPENKLKQLIAIAANQAGYDSKDKNTNSEYRQLILKPLTGKTSATQMNKRQLTKVLQNFIDHGFTVKTGPKRTNPDWLKKLISLWKTMHAQGFVREPGFAALEQWAKSQLQNKIDGDVPAKLDWMGKHNHYLIEGLKSFHFRVMKNVIQQRYEYLMDEVFAPYKHQFTSDDCTSLQFLSELMSISTKNYPNCAKAFDIITLLTSRYEHKERSHE